MVKIKQSQKGMLVARTKDRVVSSLDIVRSDRMRNIYVPNHNIYSEEYFQEQMFSAKADKNPKHNDVEQKVII